MFRTFGRSWELTKQSWAIRQLLLFPLMSGIGVIFATILFAIPFFASGIVQAVTSKNGQITFAQSVLNIVLLFLFYFVTYTIIIYSNSALVGAVMMRLKGQEPTVSDGFKIANERLGKILGYAAIAATVGVILNSIRSSARESKNPVGQILGSILASIVQVAWNIVTFLVVPVLVVENVGPIEAIKRSGALLKKTWGEQLVGSFGVGMVFGLITFLAIIPLFLILVFAISTASVFLIVLAVILFVAVIGFLNLLSGALGSIYRVALYQYATTGSTQLFNPDLMQNAFTTKNKRG
jgi:hypothetical protein